jgi:hypothetical protein
MALYNKADFARLCGVTTSYITQNVIRNKIVMTGKYIDDSISQNWGFLEKRREALKKEVNEVDETTATETKEVKTDKAKIPKGKEVKTDADVEGTGLHQLEKKKKALDIQKITEEIEILKVKKDKLHGVVIPTELVKLVMSQFSASIATSFKNGAENWLIEISKIAGLNRTQVAEARGKLIKVINNSVNEAVDNSKKMVAQIQAEHTEKREVGEKE